MKKRYSTEFTPRFSDFDLQGILNSRCYVDFLAEARLYQMTHDYGIPLDHYAKKNQTWVFSSLQMDFIRPIAFGYRFRVETEVYAIEGAKAEVDFAFKGVDHEITFATGKAAYHFVDLLNKRPIPISESDIEVFLSVP